MAEILKKERSARRTQFTKAANTVENLLEAEALNISEIALARGWLTKKAKELFESDAKLKPHLFAMTDESTLLSEVDQIEGYELRYYTLDAKCEILVKSNEKPKTDTETQAATAKRKYSLPKIELKKFDGEIRNWLGFWGQFGKIDADENLDAEDKFQYLLQATIPGTPARELVESFPPSGPNYKKAIAMLKNRFAREDLLIDLHIRELLKLVLDQDGKKERSRLRSQYDKIMTQIHALESLNVTKEKYASMLYPMVESALPEDVLRAWERHRRNNSSETSLSELLTFLSREVDSEERIEMAKLGFDFQEPSSSQHPAAACIVAGQATGKVLDKEKVCIWCQKPSHSSSECMKANKMTLEERRELLKKRRACFKCLREGHSANKCRIWIQCFICQRNHYVIMCPNLPKKENKEQKEVSNAMLNYKNNVTLLPTLLVNICHGKQTITVRALVDSGSQRSYIKSDIAKKLGLKEIGEEKFGIFLFGGSETKEEIRHLYDISVKSLSTDFLLPMKVLDQNKICGYVPRLPSTSDIIMKLSEENIVLSDQGEQSLDISLLIGSDYLGHIITSQFLNIDDSLVAVNTKLGWTVQGRTSGEYQNTISTCFSSDLDVHKLWDLEAFGVRDPIEVKSQKRKEEDALEFFKNTVTVNADQRYEVELLWKDGRPDLKSNYKLALSRLYSTTKRLVLTGNYDEYDRAFKEWLELGIIEEVGNTSVNGHYLCHHCVVKESSLTTRVRPVFDASAKDSNGNSINSCLEKGVNLIEKIPKLITQFRKGTVAVTSDIKKAFLQISLSPEDRDFLRFLWWRDSDQKELIIYRHCRVVFGIACRPFLLSATLLHHLENPPIEFANTASILSQSFYVDNCVASFPSEEDARRFKSEAEQLMQTGKFDLRSWVIAPSASNTAGKESVLGLNWGTNDDTLSCGPIAASQSDLEGTITKRKLLSYAHRVFDPIGFTSPTALIPKILMQKACQLKLKWDEAVPHDIQVSFRSWLSDIQHINECRIPRRITESSFERCSLSLHIFCDASKDCYASCIFLRSCFQNKVTLRLVAAKSRVAPLRTNNDKETVSHSIPRLELLACLIGARLCREYTTTIDVEEVHFWSDSCVALTWIQKDSVWNTFVGNRVKEIRQVTKPAYWRHVPGSMNPADLLSRGCTASELKTSSWWNGPEWLRLSPATWPSFIFSVDSDQVEREMRKTTVCQVSIDVKENSIDRLCYFSKYSKIVRTVAWIFRFVSLCKSKGVRTPGFSSDLSTEEFITAELSILRAIQVTHDDVFEENIRKSNLQTFIDEHGLKRVKTRLSHSEEVADFKAPILLSSKSCIVERLVRFVHEQKQHAGAQFVISLLRERFWIVGVRRLTKRVVRSCIICKKFSARSVQVPTPPLPEDRIKNAKAFEVTGVDMAGPLILKSGEKCWIALFTCAVYRAVHLELCLSLSTDCFLMALRRFIARRGRPEVMYSDNGTNFVGACNKLKTLNWDRITKFSVIKQIKWRFSIQCAPWYGGWWERLIRLLKELLRRVLGRASVLFDELETILADCESTINSRPLTYIADDSEGLKPLTPALFLQGVSNSDLPDLDTIDHSSVNSRLRYMNTLRKEFRSRFRVEYLGLLVERGKEKRDIQLKTGDVVLVEADCKRVFWPLGVILEVYTGRDGHARSAKVKTTDGIRIRQLFED